MSSSVKWELQGFRERTDPQALRTESPTAVLMGEGFPWRLRQAETFPCVCICPCLGIIFAIISNPVMNISMQRTFCFFHIISLETEFLEQELPVKGEGYFQSCYTSLNCFLAWLCSVVEGVTVRRF